MTITEPTNPTVDIEKESYHEKYAAFKKEGHPFWPDIIFEDTIAVLVVLGVILALAVIEGVPLGAVANPSDTGYVPRPEWYFMFLFELLKYFPGALEWVGVAVVPGLAVLFMLLLPFLDRHPIRQPAKRPVAMSLAVIMVIGIFFLTIKAYETTPASAGEKTDGVQLTAVQQMGRNIYQSKGCSSCHVLAGAGSGIPLDGIGGRRTAEDLHNYIENPLSVNPQSSMPSFIKTLSHQEVDAVAKYLYMFK